MPEPERTSATSGLGRRHFLIGVVSIGAGLALGIQLGGLADRRATARRADEPFLPNAWLEIAPDDAITLSLGKAEMGQAVSTSFAMLIAEELDIDPGRLRVRFAGVDPAFHVPGTRMQFTGGSMSVASSFMPLREAGAMARAMLLAAAAKQWGVDAALLRTDDGVVTDGERRARYGELAATARELPAPARVRLKDPVEFRYIGKPMQRLDGHLKVTGRARFGIDVQRPNMLIAVIARAPTFGGRALRYDDRAARAVRDVVDVVTIPSGIAVLATNTWAARRGRDALEIEWDAGPGAGLSTADVRADYQRRARTPGTLVQEAGDVRQALAGARRVLDAEYEVPFLAHACMEPLNCVADVSGGRCELWTGTQFHSVDVAAAAKAAGIGVANVALRNQFLGGGFGRRANPQSDFVVEAVQLSAALGRPVKTMWTREDDVRGGWYRPFYLHRVRGGFDARGTPIAWHHTIVGQSVIAGTPFAASMQGAIDPTSVEGVVDMPYAVPNRRVELHTTQLPIPVQWWRSVGHSHTAFVVNAFLDELAAAARQDPFEVRRALLANKPRHLAVLERAAERGGWGSRPARGRARGIALAECFGSIVAQVAEVSVARDRMRVHRVTCAIDCGLTVNPAHVAAQMESAVVFGLSAALRGAITLKGGLVEQGNFNDYPVLRINEMPQVETHILPSDAPPAGVGEPGVPCIAPAVCNAIYAATGRRVRRLPIAGPSGVMQS